MCSSGWAVDRQNFLSGSAEGQRGIANIGAEHLLITGLSARIHLSEKSMCIFIPHCRPSSKNSPRDRAIGRASPDETVALKGDFVVQPHEELQSDPSSNMQAGIGTQRARLHGSPQILESRYGRVTCDHFCSSGRFLISSLQERTRAADLPATTKAPDVERT